MSMNKRYETIDKIIEYGIYAYIFLMFLAKGEGIRNIIIVGGFALWLMTLKRRRNLFLLKDPVSKWCWVYLGTIIISAIFSIEPLYSLRELKGAPLKFAFLFPVIATVISDEEKFRKIVFVSFFALIFIVFAAYYSYTIYDLEMLKPNTILVHAWHGRFGRYLCFLMPFSFILYFILRRRDLKIIITVLLSMSVFALILSTSRMGYAAFILIILVWSYHLSKKTMINAKKTIAVIVTFFILTGGVAYFIFPDVSTRIDSSVKQIYDLNDRTQIWRSAGYAIKQRPLTGWGYGNRLFHIERPYKETPYKEPPIKGPHNIFIEIAFHQGILGLIPYTLLLLTAVASFWKAASSSTGIKSYIYIACVSVVIGNFILQNMLSFSEFDHLAVVLGMGIGVKGLHEDSHN